MLCSLDCAKFIIAIPFRSASQLVWAKRRETMKPKRAGARVASSNRKFTLWSSINCISAVSRPESGLRVAACIIHLWAHRKALDSINLRADPNLQRTNEINPVARSCTHTTIPCAQLLSVDSDLYLKSSWMWRPVCGESRVAFHWAQRGAGFSRLYTKLCHAGRIISNYFGLHPRILAYLVEEASLEWSDFFHEIQRQILQCQRVDVPRRGKYLICWWAQTFAPFAPYKVLSLWLRLFGIWKVWPRPTHDLVCTFYSDSSYTYHSEKLRKYLPRPVEDKQTIDFCNKWKQWIKKNWKFRLWHRQVHWIHILTK